MERVKHNASKEVEPEVVVCQWKCRNREGQTSWSVVVHVHDERLR